jgi:hypothetical protein
VFRKLKNDHLSRVEEETGGISEFYGVEAESLSSIAAIVLPGL